MEPASDLDPETDPAFQKLFRFANILETKECVEPESNNVVALLLQIMIIPSTMFCAAAASC